MSLQVIENNNWKVNCLMVNNKPWFRATDIAKVLGYVNTAKAISQHITNIDNKKKFEELVNTETGLTDYHEKISFFINEPGLYTLIMKSNMPDAIQFQEWVTSDVLPSIREHGYYQQPKELPQPRTNEQISLMNEQDLQL